MEWLCQNGTQLLRHVHVMSCEKPLGCLFNVFFFLLSSLQAEIQRMSVTQPAKIQIDVMRLCEEVQRCPCLYDGSLTHNRDVEKDSNLWREIAKNLGVSESAGRIKWKSLRDKLVKTRKRLQLKRRSCATLLLLPIYIPWWAGSLTLWAHGS